MADEEGVTGAESPTEGTVANTDVNAASSTAQGVNAASPTDRPEQNWQREFQRKQHEQAQQLEAVLKYLVARDQAAAAPASKGPVTDEELWEQAKQGDRAAFDEYQRRTAQREIASRETVTRQAAVVQGQLQALMNKYPVLNNPQHPLTQVTQQAYQLLLSHGYPANHATLLEAAKTAIADRPDLVAEHYTQNMQAREQLRQDNSRRAQSGVMGGSSRQEPRNTQSANKVSPEAAELARRMGIKDPEGAMKRHEERQRKGQSAYGAVGAFLPEVD